MTDAVCVVPVSPIRSLSSHKSEMVSQLLFGDVITVLEDAGYWKRIHVQYDDYEGWCTGSHLMPLKKNHQPTTPAFTGEWVNIISLNDVPMKLPFGCDISLFLNASQLDTADNFRYDGSVMSLSQHQSFEEHVTHISNFFLNTAYLWGGRSVFGIDCSGFSQLVFKMAGKRILRDAWQQAEQGAAIGSDIAKRGDLAFFNNEEGRVVHVGILLDHERIIHAAGKVRIDGFSAEGILNVDSGAKTHSLSGIKRYS